MRKIKWPFPLALFSLLALVILYLPLPSTLADQTVYQVNIATSPASGFLTAQNLAPGDQVTSLLQVQNKGNLDFDYTVSANMESGAAVMYNDLNLTLSDPEGILYRGALSGLQNFPLGTLAVAAQRELTFTAALPLTVGNDAQQLTTSAAFVFNATDHEIGTDCFEPPFSNENFTLQQGSTVPIKFHLCNADGSLDPALHPNVKLVITGPGVNGGTVAYTFAVSGNTLKYDNSIKQPDYNARFSTFDFPVLTNGTYTASVYDGTKLCCLKQFLVLDNGNRSNAH